MLTATCPDQLRDLRCALAAEIALVDDRTLAAEAEGTVIATGGTLNPRRPGHWGPHEFTVTIYGITGQHPTLHGAMRAWADAVRHDAEAWERDQRERAAA